jgi:hypothetical protein
MLKRSMILTTATTVLTTALTTTLTANVSFAGADNWEYQGKASTGEGVTVNLDSVKVVMRSLGIRRSPSYFFTYRIGSDEVFAITDCTGTFSPSKDGDRFDAPIAPNSRATRRMLDRVCNYRVNTARVFSPPSNVRMGPNGNVLCTIPRQKTITTYGQEGAWVYTDACGKLGMIHSSQIR